MTLFQFYMELRKRAPKLVARVETLPTWDAIYAVGAETGHPMPDRLANSYTMSPVGDTPAQMLDLLLARIVSEDFREPFEVTRRGQGIAVFTNQLAGLAVKGKHLQAVLTRQIEALSDNQVTAALAQIHEDEREAIGWSSW